MNKYAWIFPGQGAQYPGMCKDFYENFKEVKLLFEEASDALSYAFSDLLFESSAEKLGQTQYSQPAIFLMSAAIIAIVQKEFPSLEPTVCAGLSLGEYTALFAAKKMNFIDALHLVSLRGKLMQQTCEKAKGAMRVVLGLPVDTIHEHLPEGAWIANLNCPGQVVIAGFEECIMQAEAILKSIGAKRVLALDVSGAFHTPLMESAQSQLKPMIASVNFNESAIDVIMNVTGQKAVNTDDIRLLLTEQVVKPTYWAQGIETIESLNVTTYIEMGPGKTLAGMNKKIGCKAPTISIEKVVDLALLETLYATT